MSAAVEFTSVREAREHFKEFLDAATTGRPATVSRDLQRLAIVDVAPLLDALEKGLPARAEVVAEEGGWSIFLPGLPIAADGTDLEQAVDEQRQVVGHGGLGEAEVLERGVIVARIQRNRRRSLGELAVARQGEHEVRPSPGL